MQESWHFWIQTHHFLRVGNATSLYLSGVDEQLVVEHTGHRSIDGVWNEKCTSENQKVVLSGMYSVGPFITTV